MSLRRRVAALLAEAGVPSPQADADILLAFVSGGPRGIEPDLAADQLVRLGELVDRRRRREPVQHIVGEAGFRYLDLRVGPGVFVPRPETEVLVDVALAAPFADAIDLCAGSAAIALSLATEAGVPVTAVEVDTAACAWAQHNIDRLGAGVHLVQADVCADELSQWGPVDLVVSNPPYIPSGMVPRDPEVADHDPHRALFGGHDGLDVIRCVVQQAAGLLRPGGRVLIEHAERQGPAVVGLLVGAGFAEPRTWPDLTGRPRVSGGRLPDASVRDRVQTPS